ncbi:MAG: ABC transporter substrate-binding protein [Planctomycetes bacterium]|nr:ABC transporter substrate-binding protein [Planctomycetota bacterium]
MERQARSTQARPAPRSSARARAALGIGILIACAASACAPEPPRTVPPGSGPILVGEFHSLTGPLAERGRALHDGFQLAVLEWNARGGIHGRPIEVRTFDDRGIDAERRVAVRRLLDEDRAVLLVGGTTPEAVEEAADEADGAPYVASFGRGLEGLDARAPRLGCATEALAQRDRPLLRGELARSVRRHTPARCGRGLRRGPRRVQRARARADLRRGGRVGRPRARTNAPRRARARPRRRGSGTRRVRARAPRRGGRRARGRASVSHDPDDPRAAHSRRGSAPHANGW